MFVQHTLTSSRLPRPTASVFADSFSFSPCGAQERASAFPSLGPTPGGGRGLVQSLSGKPYPPWLGLANSALCSSLLQTIANLSEG